MKQVLGLLFCLMVAYSFNVCARPKVGLALSGGGSRAFAHIGVLKALEANRIQVDYITGTSMGALIGALYAIGYTAHEIESIVLENSWRDILNDELTRNNYVFHKKEDHHRYVFDFELGFKPWRFMLPNAVVTGHRLNSFLQALTYFTYEQSDFSKFPIPFAAFATNIETGGSVLLNKGNLGKVLFATMAYPGYVSPPKIEDVTVIDGYFSNNIPVKQLKDMGATYIIASDVSYPMYKVEKLKGLFSVADQSINILVKRYMREDLKHADLILTPDIGDLSSTNFDYPKYFIETGEEYAKEKLGAIQKIHSTEQEYLKSVEKRVSFKRQPRDIFLDKVVIGETSIISKNFIVRRISLNPGSKFGLDVIKDDLDDIFGWGDLERVEYWLAKEDGKNVLTIEPKEKDWGPNYLRFGLQFDTEVKSVNHFIGLFSYTMNYLNRFGAIWKNEVYLGNLLGLYSELYQPITYGSPYFLKLTSSIARSDQNYYLGSAYIDQYQINRFRSEGRVGVNLGKNSEFFVGAFASWINARATLDSTAAPKTDSYLWGGLAGMTLDRLDQRNFPTKGILFSLLHERSYVEENGSNYRKTQVHAENYLPLGPGSFFYRINGGISQNDDLPFFDQYLLGGFGSFSGYRRDELRGDHLTSARLGYTFRPLQSAMFLFRGIHTSVYADIGNTWNNASEIGVAGLKYAGGFEVGLDTKISPIYLGYGQQGKSNFQVYFRLGPNVERKSM